VIQSRLFLIGVTVAGVIGLQPAFAQQPKSEWFVPNQQRAPSQAPRSTLPRSQAPVGGGVAQPSGLSPEAGQDEQGSPPQQVQVQLPPAPEVPQLPKGQPTPAAIVGILSVPDVLRVSTAYQAGDKELGARRQKLNEDAQKEQAALRDLGQGLANDRAKLSPEQIRNKERELQDRIAESRRKFGERNRIIQEAGQYVMAQIDRTLEQVAQAVAQARGVNLVLNRAQILGTTADFDLTPQVADVLNKVLPNVVIPPDGISPVAMDSAGPTSGAAAGTAAAGAKPAPAPSPAASAAKPPANGAKKP
jgi:Skp family chaperone for outer membrane proteins